MSDALIDETATEQDAPPWYETYRIGKPQPMPALPADADVLTGMVFDWLIREPGHSARMITFLGYGPEGRAWLEAAYRWYAKRNGLDQQEETTNA